VSTKATKLLLNITYLLLLLSIIRLITGASDLTSVGTASAALLLSVPIVLAGLGGLFSERAGVVNIGLEGMMIMGAWAGGLVGSQMGPWLGLLAAVVFGAVGALIHAVATISFGVDHVVSGVAINIIAAGLVRYLSTILYQGGSWPGPSQSPDVK
jgi:simple sugar transport system permease protein